VQRCPLPSIISFNCKSRVTLTVRLFRWGEALRLEEQRIRIEEAAAREEALQVSEPAALRPLASRALRCRRRQTVWARCRPRSSPNFHTEKE
jgi:hypothetical protein